MRSIRTRLALPAAAVFLLGACGERDVDDDLYDDDAAMTEERGTMVGHARWDADQNTYIDDAEFVAWWSAEGSRFDWDLDDERGLTREEYNRGIFELWDENGDGRIDESEWRSGSDRVWGEGRYQTSWTDWDMDGDSELDLNEVQEGLERDGLYDRVDGDRDALIDDEELADWFFDIFDGNDDSRIDTTEWESTWLEDRR